jgi:hypothetical protein
MLKRLILWTLLFALIYFGAGFTYWLFWDATGPGIVREMTDEQRAESKRLFKKHGNSSAVCDHDGTNCYFIRNGRKIKWM